LEKAHLFLNLVHRAVDERGRPFEDYLTAAVHAARNISENISAEDAATEFIRVLYGDPIGGRDRKPPESLQDSI